MKQKYEYEFVRLGEGILCAKCEACINYQEQIQQHARDGRKCSFAQPAETNGRSAIVPCALIPYQL